MIVASSQPVKTLRRLILGVGQEARGVDDRVRLWPLGRGVNAGGERVRERGARVEPPDGAADRIGRHRVAAREAGGIITEVDEVQAGRQRVRDHEVGSRSRRVQGIIGAPLRVGDRRGVGDQVPGPGHRAIGDLADLHVRRPDQRVEHDSAEEICVSVRPQADRRSVRGVGNRALGHVHRRQVEAHLVAVIGRAVAVVDAVPGDRAVEEVGVGVKRIGQRLLSVTRVADRTQRQVIAGDRAISLGGPGRHVRVDLAAGRSAEAGEVQRADDELLATLHLHEIEAVEDCDVSVRRRRGLPHHEQVPAGVPVVALPGLHVGDRDGDRIILGRGSRTVSRGGQTRVDLRGHVRPDLVGEPRILAGLVVPARDSLPDAIAGGIGGVDRREGARADAQVCASPQRVTQRVVFVRRGLPVRRSAKAGRIHRRPIDPLGEVRGPVQIRLHHPGATRHAQRGRARIEVPAARIDVDIDHVVVVVVGVDARLGVQRSLARMAAFLGPVLVRGDILRTGLHRVAGERDPSAEIGREARRRVGVLAQPLQVAHGRVGPVQRNQNPGAALGVSPRWRRAVQAEEADAKREARNSRPPHGADPTPARGALLGPHG